MTHTVFPQQISGGMASALAGMIVVEKTGGVLERFNILGYVVVGAILITWAMMYTIHRLVPESKTGVSQNAQVRKAS